MAKLLLIVLLPLCAACSWLGPDPPDKGCLKAKDVYDEPAKYEFVVRKSDLVVIKVDYKQDQPVYLVDNPKDGLRGVAVNGAILKPVPVIEEEWKQLLKDALHDWRLMILHFDFEERRFSSPESMRSTAIEFMKCP
jgi:hypothetical protein